jgi:hypothetical protein
VPLADAPRNQQGIGFGRRPEPRHVGIADAEQHRARHLRIGHRTADEIGGRAGHRQQSRGDEAAGRGLGNGNGLVALNQTSCDFFRDRQQ